MASQLDYYISGTSPKLLIHAGTHGDEYSSINLVTNVLRHLAPQLPDYIYVPHVSPSAVAQKTRLNAAGRDLNRNFFSDSPDPEIQANIKLIGTYHFPLCVTFHEDLEHSDFYLYDYGPSPVFKQHLNQFKNSLILSGIGLYSGTDDAEDPDLGYYFNSGYAYIPNDNFSTTTGMLDDWCFQNKVADRVLVPEIPGNSTESQKRFIIEAVFKFLICPVFARRSPHPPTQKTSATQTPLSSHFLLQDPLL